MAVRVPLAELVRGQREFEAQPDPLCSNPTETDQADMCSGFRYPGTAGEPFPEFRSYGDGPP